MKVHEYQARALLAEAGVPVPKHYRGRSLLGFLAGRAVPNWRSDFFCEHLMNNRAIPKWEGVRGMRYVYARYFEQEPVYEFLHDLRTDPDQLRNFAADPACADVLKRMLKRCDELRDAYGGPYVPRPRKPRAKKRAAAPPARKAGSL